MWADSHPPPTHPIRIQATGRQYEGRLPIKQTSSLPSIRGVHRSATLPSRPDHRDKHITSPTALAECTSLPPRPSKTIGSLQSHSTRGMHWSMARPSRQTHSAATRLIRQRTKRTANKGSSSLGFDHTTGTLSHPYHTHVCKLLGSRHDQNHKIPTTLSTNGRARSESARSALHQITTAARK